MSEGVMVIELERGWAALLAVLPVLAALAVTVHVLLRKREVATAAGWIALAWLSPFVGSVLYFLFGINRVSRRALKLRRRSHRQRSRTEEKHHAPLEEWLRPVHRASWRITGRNAEAAEARMVGSGDEAYPVMLEAIRHAKRSVVLASYIFRADAVGEQFIEALVAAHQRGVAVRVLIDGLGGGYLTAPAYHRLRRHDVPAARFLHTLLPWRMPFLNLRNHKKLLICDGKECFTGGLNIGAENLASAPARHAVRDTHFHVAGPVVAQLMDDFAEDWWFTTGEALSGPLWFPPIKQAPDMLARAVTSGPDRDIGKLELVILSALAAARRSIRIATPYFLPNETVSSALALASLRGVAVDIVIPRPSDHRLVDWATRAHLRPLLEAGCAVWARNGTFDHSKLMTVDEGWTLIGSGNWDARSLRLNFELDVELYDSSMAQEIARRIDAGQRHRIQAAELETGGLMLRLRDAAARLLLPYL
jgi:cardiolipin synthase